MQSLPFGLRLSITQYNQVVFPEDCTLIQKEYDRLLDHVIKNNKAGQLRVLLECEKCKNPNAIDIAAENGHVECLHLLIEAKCPIDEAVINIAASNGYVECLQLLLISKCPLDKYAIINAARNGHVECLKLLVESGVRNYDNEFNAFRHVVYNGHVDCVRYLIQNRIFEFPAAIWWAAESRHFDILQLLLDEGYPRDEAHTYLALRVIVENNHLSALKLFIAPTKVEGQAKVGDAKSAII